MVWFVFHCGSFKRESRKGTCTPHSVHYLTPRTPHPGMLYKMKTRPSIQSVTENRSKACLKTSAPHTALSRKDFPIPPQYRHNLDDGLHKKSCVHAHGGAACSADCLGHEVIDQRHKHLRKRREGTNRDRFGRWIRYQTPTRPLEKPRGHPELNLAKCFPSPWLGHHVLCLVLKVCF